MALANTTTRIVSTLVNMFSPARNLTTREMVKLAEAGNINNQLAFKIGYGV